MNEGNGINQSVNHSTNQQWIDQSFGAFVVSPLLPPNENRIEEYCDRLAVEGVRER